MPPYRQATARAAPHMAARGLENELRSALQDDPWLQDNPGLLIKRDGLAWRSDKLYIPQALRQGVLQCCHNTKQAGHFGFLKTLHLARRQFWWPRMKADIETDWVDLVAFAEVAYNNAVHSSTGFTPFQVVHGRDFIPIPEYGQGDPLPCQPSEWMERVGGVWRAVKEALVKAGCREGTG
ncbi:hypothetical protein NXF25_018733 [Crotalus adamanteus]|uniref:Gypsy retrotransposon integrase-like protein 1 n=1 Tax=Crotalus adamanteus TaxID=8729 RepID=A0AAW1AZY1_CROAD